MFIQTEATPKALNLCLFPAAATESSELCTDRQSGKTSCGCFLIAKSARRRGEIAMQTAGSGPDFAVDRHVCTLLVTASGHPGILGAKLDQRARRERDALEGKRLDDRPRQGPRGE